MALLELSDVSKAFGRVVVADHLSLSIDAGTALGIVGPNGAGKTSLLNLITGNTSPDTGRIALDGHDITNLATHRRARLGIARTHQIPRPFGGISVLENVMVGAQQAGSSRGDGRPVLEACVEALRITGLLNRANILASALSLLDRKRLELARALATRPRLMLLDEIAGGLTEPEVEELIATILALRQSGVTIIWIEHLVQALLSSVDRLMAMSDGRKLIEGEPHAVMASREVQQVYLGLEMTIQEIEPAKSVSA